MEGGVRPDWMACDMITINIHHEVGAALAVSGNMYQSTPSVIKLGVDRLIAARIPRTDTMLKFPSKVISPLDPE